MTTTVRKLLFNGYTEPSVLKYLNAKYKEYNISFQCAREPFDSCGLQQYSCSDAGNGLFDLFDLTSPLTRSPLLLLLSLLSLIAYMKAW